MRDALIFLRLCGLLPAASLLLLPGCFLWRDEAPSESSSRAVLTEVVGGLQEAPGAQSGAAADPDSQPKVPLDPDESLIKVINVNLDLDTHDEQILLLRRKGEAESSIKVAVVDYDSVRERYTRTWESPTLANNIRTFNLSLQDIVGDHNLELVCRGMRNTGELTLDVFRKTPSPSGLGLYFAPICQIVSDGSIDIQTMERSEAYQQGQKNGPSFPIHAYSQDKESSNPLDLVKRSWHWQYQQNKYVLTLTEKLPGEVVREQQLAELFSSRSAEPMERYLSGPWIRSGGRPAEEEMLLFLPEEKTISIFGGDVQEIYNWKASFRILSNRMMIIAENELIQSLDKRITVEVKGINTILVTIIGEEIWDSSSGTYVKVEESLQQLLLAGRTEERKNEAPARLSGLYRSQEGEQIIFEEPRFTWLEKKKVYAGGFAVFDAGGTVLYFKGLNDNGLPTGDRVFILRYSESRQEDRRVRTLVLTPGRLTVRGVVPATGNREIVFRQEEPVEPQESTRG